MATKQTKPRVRINPHPPPRRKLDGSVSSTSTLTAVRFWRECDQDSTAGKTRSPRGSSPNVASATVSREDGSGRRGKQNAGGGGGGGGSVGTMITMISDGRSDPQRYAAAGNSRGHHSQGRGARKGGSLTCPSKGDDDGDPDPVSCVSGDDTACPKHPQNQEEPGAVTSVAVRSPSPASSLASGVGVRAAAGRLWGDDAIEGTLPSEHQGGGGRGRVGWKERAGRKKGGKLGTWGKKRKPRRDKELADWLETNTNLVNVSPW